MIVSRASLHKIEHTIQAHIHVHTCISANFKDHHGTPTAFLTNFTKTVKLTKTLIACNYWRWNSFSCDYFKKSWKLLESGFPESRSIFWKKHVRPQAILWTVIAQPACLHMHINACIWDLHGELPTARKLISEHGVSEFGHMACPNSDFFFFFFFLRVSQMSFLKLCVTRATRAFYTGEKHDYAVAHYFLGTKCIVPPFFIFYRSL